MARCVVRIPWEFDCWKASLFLSSENAHFTDEKDGGLKGTVTPLASVPFGAASVGSLVQATLGLHSARCLQALGF